MQFHWLNKKDSENLIVFFAGWSFDYKPFEFMDCGNCDVLFVYDYNSVIENELETIRFVNNYKHKTLLAWSMGVYAAYKLKDFFKDFDTKVAINGTVFPVDNEFGIPEKPFLLTLRYAKTGLEGKFYQNIFDKNEEFDRYLNTPVERSIENRVDELKSLYEDIENSPKEYEKFYDFAFVSKNDKIIPPTNQINFWENFKTPYKILESGHFPYYNFKRWKDYEPQNNQKTI